MGGGRATLSSGQAPAEGATVWLVTFDDGHDTQIARGENRGRSLHNANVVRELTALGTWSGEAKSFPLDLAKEKADGRGGCRSEELRVGAEWVRAGRHRG